MDTESVYWRLADWAALSPARRAALMANQTLAGRVLVGPVLRLEKLVVRETERLCAGDYSHVKHWLGHVVLVAALFAYISGVAGMPWWQYVLLLAWPAFGVGWLRSFIEHRHGARHAQRTAITESNAFWSLLFLNNNLHAVHHTFPKMAWYAIPRFWRENRDKVLAHNGHYYFRGYYQIARRWLLAPVFVPAHPKY